MEQTGNRSCGAGVDRARTLGCLAGVVGRRGVLVRTALKKELVLLLKLFSAFSFGPA